MPRRIQTAALILVASLLGGCAGGWFSASPERSGGPAVQQPVEDNAGEEAVADLVTYAQRALQMSTDEQRREVSNWTQALARERGERATLARLHLGLLLMLPGTAVQDDVRAQSLLEPYANAGPGASLLRQFGALLHNQVAERLRGTRRADQLKEQLDALRAVERSLIERGQRPPTRKP